jgi:hypothetical protein
MPELTITAIARKAGVRPSTLRYYEKIGLLPLARRVAGRRRYDVCVEAIGAHRLRQTGGLQSGQNPGPPGRCLQREAARPPLTRPGEREGGRTGPSYCQSTGGEASARSPVAVSVPQPCRVRRPPAERGGERQPCLSI